MGFLNPNNLLWAISIAILFAIYLRSRSRPTLEVSSLLLFDETPAPAARVRHLRIDPLFWLEMAALGAVTLALGGLYIRTAPSAQQGRSRTLVFDLAAGMSAREGSTTRLDLAKKEALALIDSAPERDQFSVIGYALEADMIHPETANRDSLRHAILQMQSMAVPAHPAALSAALMRARAAGEVDFFADRRPPDSALEAAGLTSRFSFHHAGEPEDNLAIVSLDPGIPKNSRGRVMLKNFGSKARLCELGVECAGQEVFHQPVMLGPHEQVALPFGPLSSGGLVHARILSADALAADNDRYAYAPTDSAARVLVLSPDASVRDDMARVLLAVDSSFIVATEDPARFAKDAASNDYALAVMHDCYVPAVKARSILLIYPPAAAGAPSSAVAGLQVGRAIAAAELSGHQHGVSTATPTMLSATRILTIPEWMTVYAWGAALGVHEVLPLAAIGSIPAGQFALLAFDVRDHLLLDADRLDALVTTVDLVRELTAPTALRIVPTGTFLALPAAADAKLTAPDGSELPVSRDRWGRVRVRPLNAGHYRVESPAATAQKIDLYANYYDASESDLSATAAAPAPAPANPELSAAPASGPKRVQPLTAMLLILAFAALLLESGLLLRHANRWGMRHV